MKPIRNKTYRNFMTIMNYLMKEKHYNKGTAERLTHQVFDNMEYVPGSDAWTYAKRILSREDFEAEYPQA